MCVGVYVCFHVGVDTMTSCTMVKSCEEDNQRRVELVNRGSKDGERSFVKLE
jgi:hypothetical protein